MTARPHDLAARTLRALRWTVIGVAARALLQLMVMVAMARWVGPEGVGVFGICLVAYGLSTLVADLGLGVAMVQCETLDRTTQRRAFGRLLLSHALCAGLLWVMAPSIAAVLGTAHAAGPLALAAAAALVTGLQPLAIALLKRELDFAALQRAQFAAYAIGFGVLGLSLAATGFAAWSFAAALFAQQVILSAWVLRASRQPLLPMPPRRLGALQRFGLGALASNLANWVIEYLPSAWLARHQGAAGVGLYHVAHNLARTPTNHIVASLQQLTLSASSRVQHHTEVLATAYLATLKVVATIVVPLFAAAAVVPSTVITGLYGPAWADAVPLFTPLALAMPLHALMAVSGSLLWGRGRADLELRTQIVIAVLSVVGLGIAARVGLLVFAWTLFGLYAVRSLWLLGATLRELRVTSRRALAALATPVLLGLAAAASAVAADGLLRTWQVSPPLALLVLIACAALLAVLCTRFAGARLLGRELQSVVARLSPRWQRWLGVST